VSARRTLSRFEARRRKRIARLKVRGVAFDMYGTVVDVGAVAEACQEVALDPIAFNTQWRAKQLEYPFLRSLMGKYQDFWKVSEQALEFTCG
jgi:2-haloacid dehalogenase